MPRMRDTMRSGRNGSSASYFSPTPTNFTGAPVTLRIESAAPPRASPSSLVRITPVTPSRLWNSPAERTASCPIMASATNRISAGFSSRLSCESSFISSSSMCRRPAVSTRITSHAESFASRVAPRTISSGLSVPAPGQIGVPVALATCASCSRAAGRYTSVETTIGRWPCSPSHLPSLPVEVVLPEPCSPQISHTEGGREENCGRASRPSRSASSSRTIFTTCWSGESCSSTSEPSAFSRTCAMNSSATPRLTSASSSDSRISRERRVEVLLGQLALPAQILERALQFVCKCFKHAFFSLVSSRQTAALWPDWRWSPPFVFCNLGAAERAIRDWFRRAWAFAPGHAGRGRTASRCASASEFVIAHHIFASLTGCGDVARGESLWTFWCEDFVAGARGNSRRRVSSGAKGTERWRLCRSESPTP